MVNDSVWAELHSMTVDTEFEQAEAAAERLGLLTKQFYHNLINLPGALPQEHAYYLTGIFLQTVMNYGRPTGKATN